MSEAEEGLRGRLTSRGEDALGKLAQDLLDNPLVSGALSRAFDAREKAAAAQEVAMGALNIPSAADIERLTRRLRSVSQRIEGLEDGIDRIDHSLSQLGGSAAIERRLVEMEEQLGALTRQVAELADRLPGAPAPIPVSQERLRVEDGQHAGPPAAGPRRGVRPGRTRSGRSGG
jgi:septal ring factor EnvC (AmiA/AmiB activator)